MGKTNMSLASQKSSTPFQILQRTSVPLVLFTLTLTCLLFLSQSVFLPALLMVDISGSKHNAHELKTYHEALLEQVKHKQEMRSNLVLSMQGTDYRKLSDWKQSHYPFQSLLSTVSQVSRSLHNKDGDQVVFIDNIKYFPVDGQLKLNGNVKNAGPRSMTILAQLVEELRSQPFVESLKSPSFSRIEDSVGGFITPFDIQISLK
ncbi:hypothetical protein HOD24_04205 [Candidatus Peregrinibacteria bacterium]|nr:hypothetical protein [Candidatus Peregrinibacteria bacterium]MBT4367564.1 hypothetical protein [Candidatus Peregrinibacteria bacterium]MBT6731222.1 hypothetical protein [Candidatus Peregrinibacteria bacterium]MBT7344543.1 hypothetical protein [Candidatus Peregrinibacteria bacterium]